MSFDFVGNVIEEFSLFCLVCGVVRVECVFCSLVGVVYIIGCGFGKGVGVFMGWLRFECCLC